MARYAWLFVAAMLGAVPCAAQTTPTNPDSSQLQQPLPAPVMQVTPTPPDFPRGKISGQVFADYYYNLVGDPQHRYNSAGADSNLAGIDGAANASPGAKNIGKDLSGVLIRRIYFQADNDLSIRFSTRFRLEADSKSLTSDGKLGVAVKAGYLQVKSVYPRGDLYFGLFDTPTWDLSEEFWQYRSIEKMLPDFRGIGSRADLGVQAKGFFDPDHRLGYTAMVGNGLGQKPENNRQKKFYLSLPIHIGDLRVEPYGDYEAVFGGQDRATYKLFAGFEFRNAAIGVEALDRVNHRPTGGNQEPRGLSIFARATPMSTLGAFARVDLWQPDHRLTNRVDQQLWIAGLDWQPIKDVHFMPNVEATQFDAKGTAVAPSHHDVQARLTVYYRFSKPQS